MYFITTNTGVTHVACSTEYIIVLFSHAEMTKIWQVKD